MLAKILEEMWVEPEVLEALSEDQKRILFCKMREEQVRRWKEREEGAEEEVEDEEDNGSHGRPRKAPRKHVTWLLGRDGDVRVSVIGEEEDDFRPSKLLQSLLNNRYHDACMLDVREAASSPELKETEPQGRKLYERTTLIKSRSLEEVVEEEEAEEVEEEETGSGSAREETRGASSDSDCELGVGAGDSLQHHDWASLHQPRLRNHGNRPPLRAQSLDADRTLPLDGVAMGGPSEEPAFGRRVAQLKRTFAPGTTVSTKPPLPIKPPHLQPASRSAPQGVPQGIAAS